MIDPSHPDYDAARQVHNLAFDRRPAMIVQPLDATDVAATVRLARDAGLPIAVRSGGHSLAGHSVVDGGVVIDLSAMKGLHIDPARRLAWAQTGLTAGEYTTAAAAHGLATPFGDTGSVGLGGITLGGGIGFLVRKHGLTIDDLVSAEIVTADGRVVTASETQHPDLFWAIRGGGGNFGVATRFAYRLHDVGLVFGGALVLPATRDVLQGVVELASAAPEELSLIAHVMHAPPLPFIPAELVGQPVIAILAIHAGEPAAGERAVAPLRALAAPIADALGPMPYPAIYQFTAEAGAPSRGVVRSAFMSSLTDDAADAVLEAVATSPSPMAIFQLRVLGGAMARVPSGATAFAHRAAPLLGTILTPYEGEPEPHVAWTESLFAAIRPASAGVYSNFLEDEGDGRIREAYPNGTYDRLADVKRDWDPENVFRLNQNIRPAA
jgi:FAD/FMN-containing dehydrogenase